MSQALLNFASVSRLQAILHDMQLHFVFQPIVDLRQTVVMGYEALMRGPMHTDLHSPEQMLKVAKYGNLLMELETLSCRLAIQRFGALNLPGKLFLNLSGQALVQVGNRPEELLLGVAESADISPQRLIIELTEHERVEDMAGVESAKLALAQHGVSLALDDFGDGRSSLRLWAQINPDIVKLDKFFVRDAYKDGRKVEALRTVVRLAEVYETPLVVEGIEDARDLAVLRDLGCTFGQGYLLGRPQPRPSGELTETVKEVLSSRKLTILPSTGIKTDRSVTVASLVHNFPTIEANANNEALSRLFHDDADAHAVTVIENDKPIGLVNRRQFFDRYGKQFHREVFGRRSCKLFMNDRPLKVERDTPIDSLVDVLVGDDQRYLLDGFIVTEAGRYAGLATGESLVKAVTERRIEAARHANPLTFLPGNIPITEHIRRLLAADVRFAAAYFDLNNFKPFNDLYGYWRGDEMIKLAAGVISSHCEPELDFVGHVGGDDFVALFQSDDWLERCHTIVAEFDAQATSLFDPEQLGQGGIEGEDRRGFRTFFPLTTISVGVVEFSDGCKSAPEAVASAAAAAKKTAKSSGSGVYVATRQSGKDAGCCASITHNDPLTAPRLYEQGVSTLTH